jgi:ParB/RepB/Spo0J family partition protein
MEAQIRMINSEDIIPNRFQPRLEFDPVALQELASSIRIHGIVQPLVVRRVQDKFEIIAGERRFKASQLIGLNAVPCIIVDIDDNESAEVAVIENTHRKDLSPIEEAKSYKKILDKHYLTQDQLSSRMGIAQSTLANKLRLLTLDEAVQEALQKNQISERHARSLLKLSDKMKQVDLLNMIIRDRLTVKQVDDEIDKILGTYKKEETVTGKINVDNKIDIDVTNINNESNDYNLSITPTEYQYRSKIDDKDDKKSIFFNNLENHPVTMEDPTLSFGFNPFKTQDIKADNNMLDLEDIIDDSDILDTPSEEETTQKEEKKINMDVYTPRELTAAVKTLLDLGTENGLDIKSEEFNFSDIYQIVIKVAKNPEEENQEENK